MYMSVCPLLLLCLGYLIIEILGKVLQRTSQLHFDYCLDVLSLLDSFMLLLLFSLVFVVIEVLC